MARKLPSLNALRTFEAAARNLSFRQAAEELFVTQGAVSRQIKVLEDYLEVPLFNRLTRAVELTDHGMALLGPVRDALDQIEQATTRIMSRSGGGILTVSTLPTFAMKWLVPRLVAFSELHPGIEVHMVSSIRPVDFTRDEIDVAIRVGRPVGASNNSGPRIDLSMVESWEGVRAEQLISDDLVAVCAPEILPDSRRIQSAEDLRNFTLLHMATRPNAWPDYLETIGWPISESRQGASFGHFFMVLEAASQGHGIALVPRILAEQDLAARRLIVAIDHRVKSSGAYYFLCRQHHWDLPKIRTFREWLRAEASA
jgi:LysR family glycine cleavage system transcriptional activator